MTNDPKDDPAKKMRKLLSSSESPLTRLPKKGSDPAPFLPKDGEKKADALPKADSEPSPPAPKKGLASGSKPKPDSAPKSRASIFGPRFWTIASIISLTINGILAIVLIVLLLMVNRMGMDISRLQSLGNDLMELPGGLYENFEKMDRASIQTNVEVETEIPVKFDLQLNQETNVVLSQDVTITNARVTVNTGGLNIAQANTTIVLPQGTTLPVFLSLTVPVDTRVPVILNVPVNIPLSQTQLNEPFVGLQQVIQPLYCALKPDAVNMDGVPICP